MSASDADMQAAEFIRRRSPSGLEKLVEAIETIPEELLELPAPAEDGRKMRVRVDKAGARLEIRLGIRRAEPAALRRWSRKRLLVLLEELGLYDDAEDRAALRVLLRAKPSNALNAARARGYDELDFAAPLDVLVAIAVDIGSDFNEV